MNSEQKIKKYVVMHPNCIGTREVIFDKKEKDMYLCTSLGLHESFCFDSIKEVKEIILKSILTKTDLIQMINNEFELMKNSIISSENIEQIDTHLKSRREYIEQLLKGLKHVL